MASRTSSEILEGFLCPICLIKFTTLEYLLEHYSDHKRNQRKFRFSRLFAFRTSLKQALRSKRRDSCVNIECTLSNRETEATTELQIKFDNEFDISIISNDTECVITRSHSDRFKEYRAANIERHGKEEDRCLAKLKALASGNSKQQFALWRRFKEVVDLENEISINCFSCEKPFDVFRWKHFCKICDALICETCSMFLKKQDAMSLITPRDNKKTELCIQQGSQPTPSSSTSSTTEIDIQGKTKKTDFRLCKNCILLLKFIEARRKTDEDICRLVEVYTKIHDCKVLMENNMIIYKEVHRSLFIGETLYNLSEAFNLTQAIGKFAMELTALQQFFHGPEDSSDKLYIAIRRAMKDFLTEVWLLPKLPTQDQIEEARRSRFQRLSARYRADHRNNTNDEFTIL